MMTTTVHTTISSTSVDGITVLMVESSDCSGISVVGTVADSMVPRLVDEKVPGNPEKLKCVHTSVHVQADQRLQLSVVQMVSHYLYLSVEV